ncbi:uncharacterized protein LOC111463085 [Cucurbita moschata]|uniref:rhamnogalacturonan endolyase n=1 Tax=Cucurbita moschata TaxID=3662 RepID=A0A6J1HHQ6_CUCMO|nr:uncharacterized protein LOC111463085 [Cucurbita moschata]
MALLLLFIFTLSLAKALPQQQHSSPPLAPDVALQWQIRGQVAIDNGLIRVTFSHEGNVIGIKYNNMDNILDFHNAYNNRAYLDLAWNTPNQTSIIERVKATNVKVVTATGDQIELSFTRYWNSSDPFSVPSNIDQRYILRRGDSGYYTYSIFERLENWPELGVDEIRIAYKALRDKFHYMAISDDRQRIMPTQLDRMTGQRLAYAEAVLITQPTNPDLKGEVDDKYQYSQENMENRVHGWVSRDPNVGFWMITASDEFRSGGPVKQELTSHVGPTTLTVFKSNHYAGKDASMRFKEGEAWKKVLGPVFIYLNSDPTGTETPGSLWEDAKNQMRIERGKWPYGFVESKEFPCSEERGSVSGRLMVRDRFAKKGQMWADSAFVGLAAPGEVGSWQTESKGYQFWTRADQDGNFFIQNIRPGNYNLYAWVPGVIGDYKYDGDVTVTAASSTNLSVLIYDPPRRGPTLWEIGIPDRKAAEFYIPDPEPTLMSHFYNNTKIQNPDKFRQYGIWARYADLYPDQDLVYNVDTDDYRRHWFYAHVTRATESGDYQATTWQIVFRLRGPIKTGTYTLRLALASSSHGVVDVRFNNPMARRPAFTTGYWNAGRDNAIARHGIHGLYRLFNFDVPSYYLVEGDNVIYLTQRRHAGPFQGVMYDYIRFEGVE